MKKFVAAVPLLIAFLLCIGAGQPGRMRFESFGFTIQPLDSPSRDAAYIPLTMSLPASDGFSPNVNVMIQPHTGTMDEFLSISKKQFGEMKFRIINVSRLDKSSLTIEYDGEFGGRKLHWYAKASLSGKTVYLVTATAEDSQWPNASAKLKACVDSFALKPEQR